MRPPNGNLNLDRAGRRAHERARSLKPCCFKINKDYHFSFFLPLCDFSQPPAVAVADGRLAAIMITIKLMMIRRRYLVALTLFAPCLACSFGDDDCARAQRRLSGDGPSSEQSSCGNNCCWRQMLLNPTEKSGKVKFFSPLRVKRDEV